MPFREHTMWSYQCDWDDCEKNAQDGTEYGGWAEQFAAVDTARDAGWHEDEHGNLFCHDHWHWCEKADEEPLPGPAQGCCAEVAAGDDMPAGGSGG